MKRKRGFSLLESVLASSVLGLVLAGAAGLTVNVIRSFNWTSAQMDADQNASKAVQLVMRDLEPAKQVTVLSPTSIRVYYPVVNADGTYNRANLDSVNTVDYYRSDANGNANANGAYLYRKPALSSGRVVCKYVSELQFGSSNPASLDITLGTLRQGGGGATTRCDMEQRAIFLRNN